MPRPLLLLLGAVTVFVLAWSLLVPPLQVPDEQAHYGYVQALAENHERPAGAGRNEERSLSTEEDAAMLHTRAQTIIQNPIQKPPWSERADARWRDAARELGGGGRDDVENIGTQAVNPPLYYLYEAIPYEVASGGDFFDRLYLMRLFSGVLMLITAIAGWLVVGELTGRRPLLQFAGAAVVALQPMTTFITSGVNPDAAFFPVVGFVLWLSVRTLLRGFELRRAAVLLGLVVLAALVKGTALLFLPAVLFALLLPLWRARRDPARPDEERRAALLRGIAVVGGAAVVVAVALVAARGGSGQVDHAFPKDFAMLREFGSYLTEFYLPKQLPFLREFPPMRTWPVYAVWLKQSWGTFGWLETRWPDAVFPLFALITVGTFGLAARAVVRRTFELPWRVIAFFVLLLVPLLGGLHWLEYRELVTLKYGIRVQGRYLLPLMPIVGVAVAAALTNFRPERRQLVAGLLVGGMAALQLLSLALVAGRFYA